MADTRRLEHAVAGSEHEGVAFALVHQAHPTGDAIDQLEADVVKVHLVGHRAGGGDADVRGNEPSSLTTRQEVAVQHSGTAHAPAGIGDPAEFERRHERWHGGLARPRCVAADEADGHPLAFEQGDRRIVRRRDHPDGEAEAAELVERLLEPSYGDRRVDVEALHDDAQFGIGAM